MAADLGEQLHQLTAEFLTVIGAELATARTTFQIQAAVGWLVRDEPDRAHRQLGELSDTALATASQVGAALQDLADRVAADRASALR